MASLPRISTAAIALGALLSPAACTGESLDGPPRQHLPPTTDPELTLLVSNQSFDLDPVDIEIRIDGTLAVSGDFLVEGQHSWHAFDLDALPGERAIVARSELGDTEAEATVTVDSRTWVVVNFWYYPSGSPEPYGPTFSIDAYDEQPLFD